MSNETKFTAGPWVADMRGGCCAVYPKGLEGETPGCHSYDDRNIYYSTLEAKYNGMHWDMSQEAQANAHLIAAAPDMYALLDELSTLVMPTAGELYKMCDKATALLAKARGDNNV